ncbi:hypothetical protein I3843_14G042900 [Carya illinoinensis]|nr:hypothetical protein I3843_14G042900 [Carya illinoinensis]KAG7946508.1 hypothetical protein I3843_14G042900 [Carya illinoinensis]
MDKPTRTIADQIVEGGDSPDKLDNQGSPINYVDLVKAVNGGDWNATRDFLTSHPKALRAPITSTGGTVLHVAVAAEQEHIVEELLNMISEEDLLILLNNRGDTALDVSIDRDNCQMADRLIRKNKSLVYFKRTAETDLPVVRAMGLGHKQLARMLYSLMTSLEELKAEKAEQGSKLISYAIDARDLDLARDLIKRCPSSLQNLSPWEALAAGMTNSEFARRNRLVRWIYNQYCVHISSAPATDQIRLDINQNDRERSMGSGKALLRQTVSNLLNLFGLKDLYEAKLVYVQLKKLLSHMKEVIRDSNISLDNSNTADAIFNAISGGNFVFVNEILQANSELSLIRGDRGQEISIFHYAIQCRQHRIFKLIYTLKEKNYILRYQDEKDGNNILHKAGELTKYTPIDHITGSVLQMQRELQWFKEVESICPPLIREQKNKKELSPRELFAHSHQELRKEGEKWMKDTATSCTVVGALIVTIMFAAAFTIPGGSNQNTGMPILVHDKLFKVFIVTDSLSLFSSSTSVLIFLGILTSRYAEEDFLKSLPTKMIIGLFTLFFSITTMMIAFSAALLLMLRGQYWIVAPIIGLAGIPVILFVLMQSSLLVDMLVSTYGPSIFDRQ